MNNFMDVKEWYRIYNAYKGNNWIEYKEALWIEEQKLYEVKHEKYLLTKDGEAV